MWKQSGEGRFQGGTLAGIKSQLGYLANLGVTTLWIAPVFRQRVEGNDFHGYGVQDFLEVDSRFGTRADLVELVRAAHAIGMRVVLDIIFNHTGSNWLYDAAETGDAFRPKYTTGQYTEPVPEERLRRRDHESAAAARQRRLRLASGSAVHRELHHGQGRETSAPGTSATPTPNTSAPTSKCCATWPWSAPTRSARLIFIYQYWIALTDCDGLRIDTLKHVSGEEGRNFCGAVKEFAESIGKSNFLLLGEVAGGDNAQEFHLTIFGAQSGRRARHRRDAVGDHRRRTGLAEPRRLLRGLRLLGREDGLPSRLGVPPRLGAGRPRPRLRPEGALQRRRARRPPGHRADRDAALRPRHSVHLLRHRTGPAQRPRSQRAGMARHREGQ